MKKVVSLAPPLRRRTFPVLSTHKTTEQSIDKGGPPNPLKGMGGGSPVSTDKLAQVRACEGSLLQSLILESKKLSATEQKELAESILLELHLATRRSPSDRDVEMWATAVYDSLQKAIGSSGGESAGPMVVKKTLAAVSSWGPVEDFMRQSRLQELSVVERQRCYNLLASMLVSHARQAARRSGAPLSAKFVSRCTGNLAGVFDNAFPGYLQAGLARVVARQHLS